MTGVGRANGGLKADRIAHFADHDDVRVLAQDASEASRERGRVEPDFPLFDD